MALDDTDRRRFRLAAIVSLLALPALWWINLDDPTTGPNTASVGVDVGGTVASPSTGTGGEVTTVESTIGRSNLPSAPTILDAPPIFMDGPLAEVGGPSRIAVPDADALATVITRATYDDLPSSTTCLARSIPSGQTVTVTNLDNNRSITCVVSLGPSTQTEDLVLSASQFTLLADLTDAPIPVQVRP